MNINIIKSNLENSKGEKLRFRFNGLRNQTEEFCGTVEGTYNYIFTIRLAENKNIIRSFSYADVLTDSLEIFRK